MAADDVIAWEWMRSRSPDKDFEIQLEERNPRIYNMTIYALTIIEIMDGLRIFMGCGHGPVKKSYRKIRYPL